MRLPNTLAWKRLRTLVFYAQHTFFFRLEGHRSHAFNPHDGIAQGCPLSMILFTSLMTSVDWALPAKGAAGHAKKLCWWHWLPQCSSHFDNQISEDRRRKWSSANGFNAESEEKPDCRCTWHSAAQCVEICLRMRTGITWLQVKNLDFDLQ